MGLIASASNATMWATDESTHAATHQQGEAMYAHPSAVALFILATVAAAHAGGTAEWWNATWRCRTTVERPTPYRDATPRPVEVAVDFPLLLTQAGLKGTFDPASVRVVERGAKAPVPSVVRTELDPQTGRARQYVAWMARPKVGAMGVTDIYFDTKGRIADAAKADARQLPPPNLVQNPGFDAGAKGWTLGPKELMQFGRFAHTTDKQSLKIVVDDKTPKGARREVEVRQTFDVRAYAGQEMVFECDLLAERAKYGVPVSILLEQVRADGSRIRQYAVQSRWLALELAQGHLVQFRQRGQFHPEAAKVTVSLRARCYVKDADTNATVTGPEAFFTVWVDRLVVRPGERWPWPAASHAGFVEGALATAPANRAFEFTGLRRLAFNGASEGALQAGRNGGAKTVHWGLAAGTLELWCKPKWNAADGAEHVLFDGSAYMHRLQSRLVKRGTGGKNRLEFTIADADRTLRSVGGFVPLRAGTWHHIAATWDFPKAHLQLFVDGKRAAQLGPEGKPWPSSLVHSGGATKTKGIGISDTDTRSMPMQAFIGGDKNCSPDHAADAALDELRISGVARYTADFAPPREELAADAHTRALFHFDNEVHGVHADDDQFVRGHLACELHPQQETAPLDVLRSGKAESRMVRVKPHAPKSLFEKNRMDKRLDVYRPFRELPDPRFVEFRERHAERTVTGKDAGFALDVAGDYGPRMHSITWERADGADAGTTLLPRWRANDNVVPFSVETLAATLAPDAKTVAEKAFEAWRYLLATTNYYDAHYCETLPGGRHRKRIAYCLLKPLNIYPFDQCGPLNCIARKLFLAVGISSNDASGTHHQFQQAFYDGAWRLHDLSGRQYWLARDNATPIGRDEMEADPYLKLRQGGNFCAWIRGRCSAARFGVATRPHNMDFPLRPGERASVCWHNEGRWFELTQNRQPIHLAKIPPMFGNGAIVYEPVAGGDAAALDNLLVTTQGGATMLRAKDPAKKASLVYRAQCPYILSDARVTGACTGKEAGAVRLALSFDHGKTWKAAWSSPAGGGPIDASLLKAVSARYAYWLRVELAAGQDASATGLRVRTTFVVSPFSLPGKLKLGSNRITFVGGPPAVPLKTTCRWVERHKTRLGVSLNAIGYYMDGDTTHRNVFVAPPGGSVPVQVTLHGWRGGGNVALEGLPKGWAGKATRTPTGAELALRPGAAAEGTIAGFDVVVRSKRTERRVAAQVLVARAALVREAEAADAVSGAVAPAKLAELSGAHGMRFSGDGQLAFDLAAPQAGSYALWLRAKWEPNSSTAMRLTLDAGKPRALRAAAMIGFSTWAKRSAAHAKMFAHFGEQYAHWAWYRVGDVELSAGKHRLALTANSGAWFDTLVLLPQSATMDRAAMNLFQNWNFAPWKNPM